jgi:hypothetical protein
MGVGSHKCTSTTHGQITSDDSLDSINVEISGVIVHYQTFPTTTLYFRHGPFYDYACNLPDNCTVIQTYLSETIDVSLGRLSSQVLQHFLTCVNQ